MTLSANLQTLAVRIGTEFKKTSARIDKIVQDMTNLQSDVQNATGIDDASTSATSTWSSRKITDADKTLSDKIDNASKTSADAAQKNATAIANLIQDEGDANTAYTWSSSKINSIFNAQDAEFAKRPVMTYVNTADGEGYDRGDQAVYTVEGTQRLMAGFTRIRDDMTFQSATWSSQRIVSEIKAQIKDVVGAAPEALDTLQEVAAAIQSGDSNTQAVLNTVGKIGDPDVDLVASFEGALK